MATPKQIIKYKTLLHKLFSEWVSIGYHNGIDELDSILKSNAGLDPEISTKLYSHYEMEELICETEVLCVDFGIELNNDCDFIRNIID
jgi:hypothetical protein